MLTDEVHNYLPFKNSQVDQAYCFTTRFKSLSSIKY